MSDRFRFLKGCHEWVVSCEVIANLQVAAAAVFDYLRINRILPTGDKERLITIQLTEEMVGRLAKAAHSLEEEIQGGKQTGDVATLLPDELTEDSSRMPNMKGGFFRLPPKKGDSGDGLPN